MLVVLRALSVLTPFLLLHAYAIDSATDAGDRRTETLPPRQRDQAIMELPDIGSFRTKASDQFLIDLDWIRAGHPYKGTRSKRPHTGAHVYFRWPDRSLSPAMPDAYPAIYAVADGVISRVDYSFRLREMFEPALGRRVANTRYGIGLLFATADGQPVTMHYSIEPFVDPGDDRFYEPFIKVKVGDRVRKGDVVARMYLPTNRELANKSHIHFNLIGGRDHRFMAPAMFDDRIVQRFHGTWNRFGRDGADEMPPCMGYMLAPKENPFGTGAKDRL